MRLAVFDLDYTIWQPEMYQLSGPPRLMPAAGKRKLSPTILREARTVQEGKILSDRTGSPMRIFDGALHALSDMKRMQKEGHDIRAAIASRTDEPRWARICMENLVIDDGSVLQSCFERDLIEISYGSKTEHFQRLQKTTGIPFEQMAFFDNEYRNIQDVSRSLPVKCFYTPDGMTRQAWENAKAEFSLS